MSGDPEQEYFCDGITEEIITALSKLRGIFVIARNSSFIYKGKSVGILKIGRELGVRYVLEGSVRLDADKMRITAQLIDAKTDQHLWAERYDRELKDIFAIQDDITMKIITALSVMLSEGEQARIWEKKATNLDVYLKQLEARSLWAKGTRETRIRFGQVAQEILDMAPGSGNGYRALAWYYWSLAYSENKSPRENIAKAFKLAQKALSLDDTDSLTHALLGSIYLAMRQYEKAIAAGERSVELDPNGAIVHGILGNTLSYAGRPDEAITYLKRGIRLNPFPEYWYFHNLGRCYGLKGEYKKALAEFKKAQQLAPGNFVSQLGITTMYSLLGRKEEALEAAKKVMEMNPYFSVDSSSNVLPYKNKADLEAILNAMRKAGLK
jgi:adenylate cyclase